MLYRELQLQSHKLAFLQRNGILNLLSEKNHLIEVKLLNSFFWKKGNPIVEFRRVGINKAISINLFCPIHDTNLFKAIENKSIALTSYQSFLLLSYRVTCAEIRKKEIQLEVYKRIFNSKSLIGKIDCEFVLRYINGLILGISDLAKIKGEFEKELDSILNVFFFQVYRYPRIDIYASAVFSPNEDELQNSDEDEQLENIYIHIIPTEVETLILVGYHKDYCNEWMENYILSWKDLDLAELQLKLSELFACRIENWGMSQNLFDKIPKKNIELFIKDSHVNISNLSVKQSIQFNLFS